MRPRETGREERVALDPIDSVRTEVGPAIERERKSKLGQFMTPAGVARFMASLFKHSGEGEMRLLDAGAGAGSLTAAVLDRWLAGNLRSKHVTVTAYEIDAVLRGQLQETLGRYEGRRTGLAYTVIAGDFIEDATNRIQFSDRQLFTHAILNPPYRKINSDSRHRLLLRGVGVETVNLYTAFVALATALMAPGGQMVVIVPRSFCNGLYYRPFREFLLERAAITHIHLFDSRSSAFRDDAVLQENIILRLVRGAKQGKVCVSVSRDATFEGLERHEYSFAEIVAPDDPERFIHIPRSPEHTSEGDVPLALFSLEELGLEVSTGPVVDFRLREYLRAMPERATVPLLYAQHFQGGCLQWPKAALKKPNAILLHAETRKWLYPNGAYTVVRRFSSKEERRRVVAYTVEPSAFDAEWLGFENHLNVFHSGRQGLDIDTVAGLAVYLNSTAFDEWFRRFSGHTQVNATDLRLMRYPSVKSLRALGRWQRRVVKPSQESIDNELQNHAEGAPQRERREKHQ